MAYSNTLSFCLFTSRRFFVVKSFFGICERNPPHAAQWKELFPWVFGFVRFSSVRNFSGSWFKQP
jgi:hypothetical protein